MDRSSETESIDRVALEITSDPHQLAVVRTAGRKTAERIGFGVEDAGRIVLALDEALANVIKHGYQGAPGRPIRIVLEALVGDGRRGIRIEVSDEGRQVDPAQICGRDLDDIRPGGLGVFLMKTMMDQVVYSKRDRGMKLEMLKYLNA